MSQIEDAIDKLIELGPWAQWATGLVATLLVLAVFRLLMRKVVLDFVKRTAFDWDDRLYSPCLLYTSPSPRDRQKSRMPSSA